MEKLLCSVSGIRGRIGITLTRLEACSAARAFYSVYLEKASSKGNARIVLCRDSKESGKDLVSGIRKAFEEISSCSGRKLELIYLGIASTPVAEWAVERYKAAGGIIITASHNPKEWNGIKFLGNDGSLLKSGKMEEIAAVLDAARQPVVPGCRGKTTLAWKDRSRQYLGEYCEYSAEKVKKALDSCSGNTGFGDELFKKIKKRNFKVVVDACSGEGAKIPVRFLAQIGLKPGNVTVINSGAIERSTRKLEPVPAHLGGLRAEIRRSGADAGFALDPDQDRLVAMPLRSEEYTPLLCGKFLLELQGLFGSGFIKKIPVNLSTTAAWEEIAGRHGVRVIRTRIGEINVVGAMRSGKLPFGAEGNGGVILADVGYGRNSAAGMALILAYMAWSGKSLEELGSEIPEYVLVKEKVFYAPGKNPFGKALSGLKGRIKSADRQDGIKVFLDGGAWVQLRLSNTEPIMRIFAESRVSKTRKGTALELTGIIRTIKTKLERRHPCLTS